MSDAKSSLVLYTATTPNGFPITYLLEELKALYPENTTLSNYEVVKMSIRDADIGKARVLVLVIYHM